MVELTDDDLCRMASDMIKKLDVDELYEIAAAITLTAGHRAAIAHTDGAVWTGFGTDQFFSGGRYMTAPVGTDAARQELAESIQKHIRTTLTEDRLVPDFHERLLGKHETKRVIHTWTTLQGWTTTARFGPEVLFGVSRDGMIDKLALRVSAWDECLRVPAR